MIRGDARFHAREMGWLREVAKRTRELHRKLDAEYLQIPEFEPAITNAQEHIAQLEAWVNEMEWIAQQELWPK